MKRQPLFFVLLALSLSVTKIDAQGTLPSAAKSKSVASGGAPSDTIGTALGLQQAVAIAIKNNLIVNQADIQMQTNKVALNQSWGNLLPQVNATASQGIGFGRSLITSSYTYTDQQTASGSYQLSANLTLFQGLQLQNTIKQNSYAFNASKLDLQQQKYNITLNVLLAYLQVLSNQDLLAIAHEQADIDSKQVDRLDAQNKEGALVLLSNLTDLRGQFAGDQANIAIAINNLEISKISLFQLLNVPYKRDVEYDRNAFSLDVTDYVEQPDSIYQTALQTQPSIKSAELRIRSYQKALAAARGAYAPTLSFYTNVTSYYSNAAGPISTPVPNTYQDVVTGNIVTVGGTPYDVILPHQQVVTEKNNTFGDQFKNNRQTGIGLQLNIPILNYLRVRNNVKQAKVNLKNSEISSNSTRLVLQQSVEQAFQNMIAAFKQYKAYMDQAAAYAESFRTTEIRFNEGVINSDVYVLAKNNMDRANTNLSQAKYTYIFRTKVLDFYQGKLTW